MIKIYNQIKLDVSRSNEFSTVFSKQGDQNSRFIIASICLDGNFICMPKNASVKLHVIRPDKVGASFDGLVMDDGRVIVPLDRWISSVAGDSRCSVEISCDEQVLTTMKFTVTTEESDDVNDIGSPDITPTDPEYDAVLELINDYKNGRLVGADGAGIDRIELMATDTDAEGRVSRHYDVYREGEATAFASFSVTDGKDGADGKDGERGEKGDKGDQGEPGPKGDTGEQGDPGADGKDGVDGKDGADGLTPHIGENGNWWIGNTDTGINPAGVGFPYARYAIPTLYFEGDISAMTKENAVTLNYVYGERSGTCTLKWQGNSSLEFPKKNYTVKFDNAFEAKEGWGEQKKYCLKADWVDFSHCRNVVSAKVWGDVVRSRATSELVTRLSALPNCGAIDGFPCFVIINGEWMGVYNFNIPKDGWMFGMGKSGGDITTTLTSHEPVMCSGTTLTVKGTCNGYMSGGTTYFIFVDVNSNLVSYDAVSTVDDGNTFDVNKTYTIPSGADRFAIYGSYDNLQVGDYVDMSINQYYFPDLTLTFTAEVKEAILCANKPAEYGCRWKLPATVGDETKDYEIEYVTDEDNAEWVQTSIDALINACINCTDTTFDTTVAQYIDIDSAIDYFIFCVLSHNSDGIGKNHLLVTYDGTKWFFSAYDMDGTWGLECLAQFLWSADLLGNEHGSEIKAFEHTATRHMIFRLIYSYALDRLIARYNELRAKALSVSSVMARFYNYAKDIPANAKMADAEKWTAIPFTDVNNVSQISTWYSERSKSADTDLHSEKPNLLTTAKAYFTDEIYNGVGYKDGYTMTSSNTVFSESVAEGYVLTGRIPYNGRDALDNPIYIKGNIEFDDSGNCAIGAFNDNNAFMWNERTLAKMKQKWNITKLGDGYYRLVAIRQTNGDIPIWFNWAGASSYIFFALKGTGEGLKISVGRPIG